MFFSKTDASGRRWFFSAQCLAYALCSVCNVNMRRIIERGHAVLIQVPKSLPVKLGECFKLINHSSFCCETDTGYTTQPSFRLMLLWFCIMSRFLALVNIGHGGKPFVFNFKDYAMMFLIIADILHVGWQEQMLLIVVYSVRLDGNYKQPQTVPHGQ